MGYRCPVCEVSQRDGEHLANHLAFAAMLGDHDHESWLDEHASEWNDLSPEALAERVVEHAEEDDHEHGHDHESADEARPGDTVRNTQAERRTTNEPSDPEVQRILNDAQELTEQMQEQDEDDQ